MRRSAAVRFLSFSLPFCCPLRFDLFHHFLLVYRDEVDDTDVALFGVVIARNTAMFGILGFVALSLISLACCYQGVTFGSEPKKDDPDDDIGDDMDEYDDIHYHRNNNVHKIGKG
jgi:hypothetical protein